MRSISSAQSAYAASCGWGFYAQTLEDLSLAPPGGSPFVGPDLATTGVVKSAYTVTMGSDALAPGGIPPTCNAGVIGTGYHATAIPLPGAGAREFGTNTQRVDLLHRHPGGHRHHRPHGPSRSAPPVATCSLVRPQCPA